MTGANTILHSPTGSGKTLGYLVPLIARLRAAAAAAPDGKHIPRQVHIHVYIQIYIYKYMYLRSTRAGVAVLYFTLQLC